MANLIFKYFIYNKKIAKRSQYTACKSLYYYDNDNDLIALQFEEDLDCALNRCPAPLNPPTFQPAGDEVTLTYLCIHLDECG
ncbi:hypothetical protein INT45_009842 [Circinella minor]|uniref:Uncharacterized protein n=1 Tax=Circinella minor TaxID=1195481 RepID=A0A8H7VPM2_9FUNG|nr:hypothetical protein INT45_009842 [Circinella minor]